MPFPESGVGRLGGRSPKSPGIQGPWVSPSLLHCPERTLMLPLTEGSLRLRPDDEDSLTSEDSFFSATEVTRVGGELWGWGGEHWVVGK